MRTLKRRVWNPGDPKLLVHTRMGRGAAMEAEGPGAGVRHFFRDVGDKLKAGNETCLGGGSNDADQSLSRQDKVTVSGQVAVTLCVDRDPSLLPLHDREAGG